MGTSFVDLVNGKQLSGVTRLNKSVKGGDVKEKIKDIAEFVTANTTLLVDDPLHYITNNCCKLQPKGIRHWADILFYSRAALLKMRGIDEKTVREICWHLMLRWNIRFNVGGDTQSRS